MALVYRTGRFPVKAKSIHLLVSARRWLRLLPFAIGAAACGGYLAAELRLGGGAGWPLDDAWIHAEFARHLGSGDGLAYRPPELVAGSTAPLWTGLLALGFLPGLGILAWGKLLGVACFLGAIAATRRLAVTLGIGEGTALLAACLTAGTGWLVWSALSGLEIALFAWLSIAGIELHARERGLQRLPLSLPLLALACLARPEGLLLLALACADRAVAARDRAAWRSLAGGAALAAAVLLPVALAYVAIGGSPLPTTFAAKTEGFVRWVPEARHLYAALGVFFRAQPLLVLCAAGGALDLAARWGGPRDRGLLPALWLFGLPLAQSLLGAPAGPLLGNFGRYLFPLLPLAIVLGLLGCAGLAARLASLPARRRLAATATLVALLAAPAAAELARTAGRFAQAVRNVREGDVAMALWLRERLPRQALLAVHDVGALGHFLPNPLIDLAGILDAGARQAMARAGAAGADWQAGLLDYLAARRPDYLVVFPEFLPFLARPELSFRLVREIRVPDNITMASDRIALYSTPWTDQPLRGGGEP